MLNEFISGGVAGSISVVAGQPLDTIKVINISALAVVLSDVVLM